MSSVKCFINHTSQIVISIFFTCPEGFDLTLWLCSGQIDPKKIFFFPKILVNVIALDSNLLTLFT